MSRPYPNRRRKRPGRRLPDRYRHDRPALRPDSFMAFGLRYVYDLMMPEVRGKDRRRVFNAIAARTVLFTGLGGAAMGLIGGGGPLGAVLGFVAGIALGNHLVRKHRFYRR